MEGFKQPAPKNPKIPDPVPLTQLDPARKELYTNFVKEIKDLAAPLEEAEPASSEQRPLEPTLPASVQPVKSSSDPNDEDKKAFVRAILGGQDYIKNYVLFGQVTATFADRSVALTERMYDQLSRDREAGRINIKDEEEWSVWAERYQLAATLRKVCVEDKITPYGPSEVFLERVQALMSLTRPYYQALMEASRTFEEHMALMTGRALQPDFWQADGANSH